MSIQAVDSPVNLMSNIDPDERAVNLVARLQHDVRIRRAAQVLADALAVRAGAELVGLSQMSPEDRDWYLSTTRSIIEIDATLAGAQPPAAQTRVALPIVASSHALILRQRGRDAAQDRGHDMGAYQPLQDGRQMSTCRKCARAVVLNLSVDPSISGSAIDGGCLSAASKDGDA